MKAYITCPLSLNDDKVGLLPEIKSILVEKNIESFTVIKSEDPKEIFQRDYNQLKSCDIIIAEVSERSHGVGVEIGLSYSFGAKIILIFQKGRKISRLLKGIPKAHLIEYEDINDLKGKLQKTLAF